MVRRLLLASFGFKVFIVALCFLLVRVHYVFTKNFAWFSPTATVSEVERAIESAPRSAIDARDENGETGLILAARLPNLQVFKLLLAAWPDLNAVSEWDHGHRRTALGWAAYNADSVQAQEMVRLLVGRGADVDVRDNKRKTPLRLLVRINTPETCLDWVIFLAKHGADINAKDERGQSLLRRKLFKQDVRFTSEFIRRLAPIVRTADLADAADFAMGPEVQNSELAGMLNVAALQSPEDRREYNVDAWDDLGLNALMRAVIRDDEIAAGRVIENRQDVDDKSRDEFARTALHLSALARRFHCMRLLLASNANRFITDMRGNTALHYAATITDPSESREVVRTLMTDVVDPAALLNAQNNEGDTLAHWAIKLDNRALMSYLAENYGKDIDLTVRNRDGKNLIELAESLGRGEIQRMLLAA